MGTDPILPEKKIKTMPKRGGGSSFLKRFSLVRGANEDSLFRKGGGGIHLVSRGFRRGEQKRDHCLSENRKVAANSGAESSSRGNSSKTDIGPGTD